MHTLYLLRHAKSDWSDPDLMDHDRPLTGRGRKAARRMGAHLATVRPAPAVVLCSSATRARATWELAVEGLGHLIDLRVEPALYGATAVRLLGRLKRLPERFGAVLVIGHNPTMQELAIQLAGDGAPAAVRRLHEKFPTAALATLSTGATWRELGPGQAYLESVVRPRDLER